MNEYLLYSIHCLSDRAVKHTSGFGSVLKSEAELVNILSIRVVAPAERVNQASLPCHDDFVWRTIVFGLRTYRRDSVGAGLKILGLK